LQKIDLFIALSSGIRPECCDDDPTLFNDQSAVITASFDGAAPVEILRWSSDPSSPLYKTDTARDEYVVAAIDAPSGAESLQLTFGLERAENDWWWAIDNVVDRLDAAARTLVRLQFLRCTQSERFHVLQVQTGSARRPRSLEATFGLTRTEFEPQIDDVA
jgi:hypothetical protein